MSRKLFGTTLLLLIVSVLLAACTAGTVPAPAAPAAPAETAAPAEATQAASTDDACAAAKAELYGMLPKVSLVGVRDDAALTSRKDINKAWPKTPADPKTLNIRVV